MTSLLNLYRERSGDPAFWAEPVNAITNGSFIVAALCGLWFAASRNVLTPLTLLLIILAMVIGVGSFLFHTTVSHLTMWLDVIPIAGFQVVFLWLLCQEMLGFRTSTTTIIVSLVLAGSFALMPMHQILNGSLFYAPSLLAVFVLGVLWAMKCPQEPLLLIIAGVCFTLALVARTADWHVSWPLGSHFLWHLLNGVVVYCAIRAWVVHLLVQRTLQN
ncbi:MAG: ceramidase domain-containing protein [Planctomycetaceae bacterium]|nr:ceramidase domain-containing protein [Planctomycetaceae bacterium]